MNKQEFIKKALAAGFESFEVYQSTNEERTITYYEGKMDSYVQSHVLGTSFRGLYNGKMATASTEDSNIDDKEVDAFIQSMIDQAAVTTSEDSGLILEPQETTLVEKENRFKRPEVKDIENLLLKIEKDILAFDERIFQVTQLAYSDNRIIRSITNSHGTDIKDDGYYQIVAVGVAAKENNQIKNAHKYDPMYDINTFDVDKFVKEAAEDVLNKLGAKSIASKNYKTIIEKEAMTSLFSAFSQMFSGDLIGKGISPIKDKLDQQIFSEKITIIDDPRNTDAISIYNYDDEGYPTCKKTLVENGKFVKMLHSTKSAMRLNTTSTGNGFKGSYSSPVDVLPMNCYIVPGEKSFDELLKQMDEGLVIESFMGLHAGIDFASTNFSLQCSGYYVKDGKRDRSVSLITAAANFLELMKNVEEIGNDLKWKFDNTLSPSILFKSIAISGE